MADRKLSYWHTPLEAPHLWKCLHDLINKWADKTPDKVAYVVRMLGHAREQVTFKELKEKSQAIAAGLLELGLKPGDFVLLTGITSLDLILCDFACASVGICTLRCRLSILTKDGLLTITNRNNVKAILFHPGENDEFEVHLRKCIPDAFNEPSDGRVRCKEIPSLNHLIGVSRHKDDGMVCVGSLLNRTPNLEVVHQMQLKIRPEDTVTCYMTSGSTGFPKAIPYSHFQLINIYCQQRVFHELVSPSDVLFNDRSLAWMGSFSHVTPCFNLTTVYVHPMTSATSSEVDFLLQVMEEEKVTAALILQYMMIDILAKMDKAPDRHFHLKSMITGGEVVQKNLITRISKYVDYITSVYGATESAFLASGRREDSLENRFATSGYIERGVEVRIVDGDGNDVPFGETGEIVVRYPYACRGYLHQESKGMRITTTGWIHTDDAGCLSPDGYVTVFGRRSHVISRGITITYPTVVERLMLAFPGVLKVAVIGVPDTRLGENICACVIPENGVSLTKEDLMRQFDAIYKTDEGLGMTPAYFVFMERFPDVNGKVDKTTLRKMMIKQLGLEEQH